MLFNNFCYKLTSFKLFYKNLYYYKIGKITLYLFFCKTFLIRLVHMYLKLIKLFYIIL